MCQCRDVWAASAPSGWNKASCPEGSGDPWREQRVLGKAKGRWRKARWELPSPSPEAAPCLLLAARDGTSCLEEPWLLPRMAKGAVGIHWQDMGIPGGWQAMAVLREGLSGEALHPQDALSPCREQEEDNPSVVRLGEHA